MEPGHVFTADESNAYDPHHDLGGRYAPGLRDEIGDRLVILDDQRTPSLELLRFRQTLTTSPGFEVALRRRVERRARGRLGGPRVSCVGRAGSSSPDLGGLAAVCHECGDAGRSISLPVTARRLPL